MATEAVSPMFGIADQVPLLIVVVPMIAAPLCIVFGNRKAAAFIAFFASLISLLCSIHILASVMDGSIISYWLGGWGPVDGGIPKGIEYRIDAANAFVLMLNEPHPKIQESVHRTRLASSWFGIFQIQQARRAKLLRDRVQKLWIVD